MGNSLSHCLPCYDLPPVTMQPVDYANQQQSSKNMNKAPSIAKQAPEAAPAPVAKTSSSSNSRSGANRGGVDTLGPLPTTSSSSLHQHVPIKHATKQPSFRSVGTPQQQQAAFEAKYELMNVIGNGSTSQVRRCRDRYTKQEYACKVIDKKKVHPQYSPVITQFENEIEILMKLQQIQQHPNIIHLEDVYITPTSILMIMEHMQGGELFDYVVQRGTLSEAEASTMIRKVTSAVAHMHAQGIIHRDLKPENLLLTKIGPGAEIKIIDFGLSKMMDISNTDTQSFLGTR
jgi:tRNA A-37 threonylcarbamoyl transferase component Bud32